MVDDPHDRRVDGRSLAPHGFGSRAAFDDDQHLLMQPGPHGVHRQQRDTARRIGLCEELFDGVISLIGVLGSNRKDHRYRQQRACDVSVSSFQCHVVSRGNDRARGPE